MMTRWIYLQMEPFEYELFGLQHYLVEFVVWLVVRMDRHAVIDIDHFPFWEVMPIPIDQVVIHLT